MPTPPGFPIRRGFAPVCAAIVGLWLAACAPSVPSGAGNGRGVVSGPQEGAAAAGHPIRFQFIYIIHGDGSYGFFDAGGRRRLADSEALARAAEVARGAADAEVFVFHQKPVRRLGFLRIADGTMRHYRNGSLLRTENYRRTGSTEEFGAEAALYRMHAAGIGREAHAARGFAARVFAARVFLYFGHGIPDTSIPSFAKGIGRFAAPAPADSKPFSLVVLSACNGGNPAAVRALAPHASRILASPGELHLSYLEAGALARLSRENAPESEGGATDARAERWGRVIAEESFASLRKRTGTKITVALYEADKAAAYLDARGGWTAARRVVDSEGTPPETATVGTPSAHFRDCAGNPAFGPGGPESGVMVLYRPPRFGLDKARTSHSGWECGG